MMVNNERNEPNCNDVPSLTVNNQINIMQHIYINEYITVRSVRFIPLNINILPPPHVYSRQKIAKVT